MISQKSSSLLATSMIRAIGNRIASRVRRERRLCILNYHRVLESFDPLLDNTPDVKTFRWHMELLAQCFNVMPLSEGFLALQRKQIPPRAICITFDDGYRSTYDLALPILRELNLPATVFVASGYLDNGNMWNDRIVEAVRRLPGEQLDLSEVGLGVHSLKNTDEKRSVAQRLTNESKYLSPRARLDATRKLESAAGDPITPEMMLTKDMVLALSQQGIEIGAHTVTHPILTSLEDKSAQQEIELGKLQLEKITGKPVRFFAYPNGKPGIDYDNRHIHMAREAGFAAAFTTALGAATSTTDVYQIPRCLPWDNTPLFFGLRLLWWLAGTRY